MYYKLEISKSRHWLFYWTYLILNTFSQVVLAKGMAFFKKAMQPNTDQSAWHQGAPDYAIPPPFK